MAKPRDDFAKDRTRLLSVMPIIFYPQRRSKYDQEEPGDKGEQLSHLLPIWCLSTYWDEPNTNPVLDHISCGNSPSLFVSSYLTLFVSRRTKAFQCACLLLFYLSYAWYPEVKPMIAFTHCKLCANVE